MFNMCAEHGRLPPQIPHILSCVLLNYLQVAICVSAQRCICNSHDGVHVHPFAPEPGLQANAEQHLEFSNPRLGYTYSPLVDHVHCCIGECGIVPVFCVSGWCQIEFN